jgi:hypothetical protein
VREELVAGGRKEVKEDKLDKVTKRILIVGIFILALFAMYVYKESGLAIASTVIGGTLALLKGDV